jgi:hypothetical protein
MESGSERTGAAAEWPGVASHEYLKAGTAPLVPGDDPFY